MDVYLLQIISHNSKKKRKEKHNWSDSSMPRVAVQWIVNVFEEVQVLQNKSIFFFYLFKVMVQKGILLLFLLGHSILGNLITI